MAVLYTQHYYQGLDSNGDPLAGGKLYTYDAGTDTPKATYTTAAGNVAHQNPIELDSAGRAVIFLSGSYKFVLKDASDNLIPNGTTDNVTAFNAGSSDVDFSTLPTVTPASNDYVLLSDTSNSGTTSKGLISALFTNATLNQPNIVGTTTNDNAAAGSVGEYISSYISSGSAVSLTTNVDANVTSISLTAGDWDVRGVLGIITAASTVTSRVLGGVSTTSATVGFAGSPAQVYLQMANVTNGAWSLPLASTRLTLSTTTTVYLVAKSIFTTSTSSAYGGIEARRIR